MKNAEYICSDSHLECVMIFLSLSTQLMEEFKRAHRRMFNGNPQRIQPTDQQEEKVKTVLIRSHNFCVEKSNEKEKEKKKKTR